MFSKSCLELSLSPPYVVWSYFISFGFVADVISISCVNIKICVTFGTSPGINNSFSRTCDWWCDVMCVSCDVTCDRWCSGGRVGALGALTPACVWAALPAGGGPVSGAGRAGGFDQCWLAEEPPEVGSLSQTAMGGSGKASLSSGLSKSIVRWCFLRTLLIFGNRGLKSNTALTLFFIPGSSFLIFFCKASFRFSA